MIFFEPKLRVRVGDLFHATQSFLPENIYNIKVLLHIYLIAIIIGLSQRNCSFYIYVSVNNSSGD